jgi:hypothetical protein
MISLRFSRCALGVCAAALLSACNGSSLLAGMPSGISSEVRPVTGSKAFKYTGAEQSFNVPIGVEKLAIIALGAGGASSSLSNRGHGGRVYAVIHVKPGETLNIFVGGAGSGTSGGFNGGGSSAVGGYDEAGYGGGGASDVRESGDQPANRILVAGGGGGQGAINEHLSGAGGQGGGSIGGAGGCVQGSSGSGCSKCGGYGGDGGTQSAGGQGGAGGQCFTGSGTQGENGALGVGGNGSAEGSGNGATSPGGGGGGGYYGGGGGGSGYTYDYYDGGGGGGGGGSSYIERHAITVKAWQGWKHATGNGLVVLDWK